MVQDIIHYCNAAGIPGILVFADQDNAYPRVQWDYLFDVMRTMHIHPEFVSIVEMMYRDVELKLKVNGVVDGTPFQPTNGIAQGCPLSPCLYLLCIQGLISLTKVHAARADGIRGIAIPDRTGSAETPVISLISAFADDLCLCLRGVEYLPTFKRDVLEIFELGAGALNSWSKTFVWHVGPLTRTRPLPAGWIEGRDIACSQETALRYLGVFLGTNKQQLAAYEARTTKRIEDRATLWRERGMPTTREGRCIALRNSILAVSWYLTDNQITVRHVQLTRAAA